MDTSRGDAHPLALAAGELVGVAPCVLRRQPHPLQHGVDVVVGFLLGLDHMVGQQGLGDDVPDGHPGIEGGVGVLEDHLHLAAPGLELLLGHAGDVLAVQHDLPGGGVVHADDRPGAAGLAAARLAHQAQGLPSADGEGHPVHRVDHGVPPRLEVLGQAGDFQNAIAHTAASFRKGLFSPGASGWSSQHMERWPSPTAT